MTCRMEKIEPQVMPAPPNTIASLRAGFDVVANHIAVISIPIALDLVLSNPGVKSLVINFCGAFARTDVMADGVIKAWAKLKPKVPVFFSIHGTGEQEAVALVRSALGIEPYDFMEDAVQAAVQAAQ